MIDVDEEALAAVQADLGEATTKKDAVNAALRFYLERKAAVGKLLDAGVLDLGVGPDIADPDIMASARR